jgi:hypothetical protein
MHPRTYMRMFWEHHEAEMEHLAGMSPWLNPIEPKKWVHGKRKVVEPDGLLTA